MITMNRLFTSLAACVFAATFGAAMLPADARPRDQDAAFDARRDGRIRPLREIEQRVMPRMNGADYLGPEFDDRSGTYRLKFMREGSVIWVDVDARTGAIIGRSGR
jgi:uncharacterized membrane protein YkoI